MYRGSYGKKGRPGISPPPPPQRTAASKKIKAKYVYFLFKNVEDYIEVNIS